MSGRFTDSVASLQKKDNYHQLVCQKQGLWVIYGDWKFIRKNSHVDLLN